MKTYTPEELKEIVRLHGMWLRNEEGGARANLAHASLCGVDLCGVDLTNANLRGADLGLAALADARLCNVNLRGANLVYANLTSVNLRGANLAHADLSHADLSHAELHAAHLYCACLCGANLCGVDLTNTRLADARLASCKGIQYVQFSFHGLGTKSRQWSAVKINGVWQAFCGCWTGTLEELNNRIDQKAAGVSPCFTASRRTGLNVLKMMCDESDAQYSSKP